MRRLSSDKLTLLQTFVALVEAGSFTAAADALEVSQPTVTRRVQALEQYFCTKLMHRARPAIELTESGYVCYERGKLILSQWQCMTASDLQPSPGSN